MTTFQYPLMSEMSDWFAVPGHIPKSKALKQLICEGLLDWMVEEANYENYRLCGECIGDGCEWCDGEGYVRYSLRGWRTFLGKVRHGWVQRDPDREYEDWYRECGEFDEGSIPATILDL